MASPFFRRSRPQPQEHPPTSSPPSPRSVTATREEVFNFLTRATSAAALPVIIANTHSAILHGAPLRAAAYVALYITLLVAAFGRRLLPFSLRAWSLVALLWAVALASYLNTGIRGDGRIWIMGAVVTAGVLLNGFQAVLGIVLSLALHGIVGWLFIHRILPLPPDEGLVTSELPQAWVNTGFTMIAIGLVAGGIVAINRSRLEQSLEESQELTSALEEERQRLERQERALRRRVAQMRAASEVARVATTLLDEQELMDDVLRTVQKSFDLYYAGIFLLDERGEYAVLRAGTGEAGKRMLQDGHRLAVGGTSMIGWCIANRKLRLALDVGDDPVRFSNPYLPHTRTELAIPLIVHDEVIGAMTIQSERSQAFDEDDIRILQGIADTLASALNNARLFRTTQETLSELQAIHAQFLSQAWSDLPESGIQVLQSEETTTPSRESETTGRLLRLPLQVRDAVVGEVVLERDTPWSEEEQALAQALLYQAGVALENAGLLTESLRRAAQEQLLGQISAHVGATLDMDQMLRTIVRELQEALGLQEAEIRLSSTLPAIEE